MAAPRIDAGNERLQLLLAQQAKLQAEIASLLPSNPSYQHHRTPIHKQQHRRSLSSTRTVTMARTASDHIEAPPQRQRTFSQQSAPAPSMARTNSRGTSSQQSHRLPFTSNGPIPRPLHSEPRDNLMAFYAQEGPFNTQALSHQPTQLQRSISQQRRPELEQVLESSLDDLEDPGQWISRTAGTPILSVSPSITTTLSYLPSSSFTPSTPASESLTTATTITTNMSRQNSMNEYMLEQNMQMMNCNSSTSYSQDQSFDQVPHFTSSHHSRRSSHDEQAMLLVGTQFPNASFSIPSSGLSGEKMEKSPSNESTSSSSSSSSRNVQRLKQTLAVRPIQPKGGEDTSMSRENSSQSMTRLESKDGMSDKVAISSKSAYQRPKHDRVYCKQCENHQEGFRGEHELRRHQDREHKKLVKKWVCIEPTEGNHPKPVLALSKCKACFQQKKKYGAYYNAAAHLRRAHFKPKSKMSRTKSNSKVESDEKRGGKGGGDWPPMSELKDWMKEVEEEVVFTEDDLAQETAEAEDDNTMFDETIFNQPTSVLSSNDFNYAEASPTSVYPTAINVNMYDMQNIQLTGQEYMQMYTPSSQNSFPSFSPNAHMYQNDVSISCFDTSNSLPFLASQGFEDDQILLPDGPDFVDNAFYQ